MAETNYDQRGVKTKNRRNVLDFIARKGEVSRQEIADTLGSSMTTILSITDFLMSKGFLEVSGQVKIARGRHPQLLKYNPNGAKALAVDYDGITAKACVCNADGQELEYIEEPATEDVAEFFSNQLPRFHRWAVAIFPDILGIGLCIPGVFSPDLQKYTFGPLSPFRNVEPFGNFLTNFSRLVGLPVYCYNDCNAASFGEYLRRGRKDSDLVFFYAGDGLGAGLILDGKLRNGAHFSAGEVGYMVYDANFQTDARKPGWFEKQLSKEVIAKQDPSLLVSYIANSLALAIANVSNILDTRLVVLDGNVINTLGSDLWKAVTQKVGMLSLNPMSIEKPICAHPGLSGTGSLVIDTELLHVLQDE